MNDVIKQRKAIVQRLNKHGYWARKFTDSETGILAFKRGDKNGPYVRIIHNSKCWRWLCCGVSEMINDMVICGHLEKALGIVED